MPPKVDEHSEVETVTIPKTDFENMLRIIKAANKILTIVNVGLIKIDRGVQESEKATRNDQSNTDGGNSGITAPAS